jgi:tetratricopeptide (TPR) repeat protein
LVYSDRGQARRAIKLYEQALAIFREVGERAAEGTGLGNLANCYADLGQTLRAIELYQQALVIAREIRNRSNETAWLGNLGNRYFDLGQTLRAVESYEQALTIAREIGNRPAEGYLLQNLSDTFTAETDSGRAVEYASVAVAISTELQEPRLGCASCGSLARAHLLGAEWSKARVAIEAARLYDSPESNFSVCALGGVIALNQGDRSAAEQMLTTAIKEANRMLDANSDNYRAFDSKALAVCGLALCGGSKLAADAIETYRLARKINRDVGVVKRVLQLFDALAVLDTGGALAGVRTAAAGEA